VPHAVLSGLAQCCVSRARLGGLGGVRASTAPRDDFFAELARGGGFLVPAADELDGTARRARHPRLNRVADLNPGSRSRAACGVRSRGRRAPRLLGAGAVGVSLILVAGLVGGAGERIDPASDAPVAARVERPVGLSGVRIRRNALARMAAERRARERRAAPRRAPEAQRRGDRRARAARDSRTPRRQESAAPGASAPAVATTPSLTAARASTAASPTTTESSEAGADAACLEFPPC